MYLTYYVRIVGIKIRNWGREGFNFVFRSSVLVLMLDSTDIT